MLQGSALALCSSRRHNAASITEELDWKLTILTYSSDINDAAEAIAPVNSAVRLLRRGKS